MYGQRINGEIDLCTLLGFPGGTSGKEPTCQRRRRKRGRFAPWVRKSPWRRKWQPTPVFLPGESWTEEPGGYSAIGLQRAESFQSRLKRLSTHARTCVVALRFRCRITGCYGTLNTVHCAIQWVRFACIPYV